VFGTIFVSNHPLQLTSYNTTIIDYHDNNGGFIIIVSCNYDGAATSGEIFFDNINFSLETESTIDQLRTDDFIHYNGPANFTVQNSDFHLHYNEIEDLDVFKFEDTAACAPNDDLKQEIHFQHNTIAYDVVKENIYNNIHMVFYGINQRNIELFVDENTFEHMLDAHKSFVNIEFYAHGTISLSDNVVTNCSSTEFQFVVDSDDHTIANSNSFTDCIAYDFGFLHTFHSLTVEVHNMIITGTTHGASDAHGSLLFIEVSILL
jgi:hypothetical protein